MKKLTYTIHAFKYENEADIPRLMEYSIAELNRQGFSFYGVAMERVDNTLCVARRLIGEDQPNMTNQINICYYKRVSENYKYPSREKSYPLI